MVIRPALRILKKRKCTIYKQNQLEMNLSFSLFNTLSDFTVAMCRILKALYGEYKYNRLLKPSLLQLKKVVWVRRKAYNAALAVKRALN